MGLTRSSPANGRALGALAGVLVLGAGMAGCSRADLYTGLNEKEANEMVAVVQNAGYSASKSSKDNGKTWTITAPKNQFPQEVALLQARGYPRDRYESLGDVFKKQGFVSSPTEERARLMYGLSQEISHTLTELDGVVDARVQISVPESDPLSDTPKPSSASVLIKYDPAYDLASQVGSIKALVVNSVEGLPYDKVTVMLSQVHAPPAKPAPSTAASIGAPALAIVAVLGGVAGFGLWRQRRRKKGGGRELVA